MNAAAGASTTATQLIGMHTDHGIHSARLPRMCCAAGSISVVQQHTQNLCIRGYFSPTPDPWQSNWVSRIPYLESCIRYSVYAIRYTTYAIRNTGSEKFIEN